MRQLGIFLVAIGITLILISPFTSTIATTPTFSNLYSNLLTTVNVVPNLAICNPSWSGRPYSITNFKLYWAGSPSNVIANGTREDNSLTSLTKGAGQIGFSGTVTSSYGDCTGNLKVNIYLVTGASGFDPWQNGNSYIQTTTTDSSGNFVQQFNIILPDASSVVQCTTPSTNLLCANLPSATAVFPMGIGAWVGDLHNPSVPYSLPKVSYVNVVVTSPGTVVIQIADTNGVFQTVTPTGSINTYNPVRVKFIFQSLPSGSTELGGAIHIQSIKNYQFVKDVCTGGAIALFSTICINNDPSVQFGNTALHEWVATIPLSQDSYTFTFNPVWKDSSGSSFSLILAKLDIGAGTSVGWDPTTAPFFWNAVLLFLIGAIVTMIGIMVWRRH